MVVGDLMLDRYWNGSTQRISPEAPVPVVKIEHDYERLGGCGNVAANVTSIGGNAYLLCTVGDDDAAHSVEDLAQQAGIECCLVRDKLSKTTVKLRVISQQQQLLRLDFEGGSTTLAQAERHIIEFERLVKNVSAVVISDYGKGGVPEPGKFIALAKQAQVPIIVDPKGRDFTKYQGASLVTPNYREFEDVVGVCEDESDIERKGLRFITGNRHRTAINHTR